MAIAKALTPLAALLFAAVLLGSATPDAALPVGDTPVIPQALFVAPTTTTTSTSLPVQAVRPHAAKPSRSHRRPPAVTAGTDDLYGPRNYRAATPTELAEAHAVVCSYDWPCEQAWSVALCESGGRWWIVNRAGSSATGIFQVLRGPRHLEKNVALAHGMFSRRGWQPWRASRSCHGL